jgi:hypothetical protein
MQGGQRVRQALSAFAIQELQDAGNDGKAWKFAVVVGRDLFSATMY